MDGITKGINVTKKVVIYSLIVLLVIPFFVTSSIFVIVVLSNPLRRSPEHIRETMLELTPIGIDMDEAIAVLEEARIKGEWRSLRINRQVGVDISNLGFSREDRLAQIERLGLDSNMAGEQSISVLFDRYRSGIAWTSVHAYWAFCENNELMEIFIRKHGSVASESHWESVRS